MQGTGIEGVWYDGGSSRRVPALFEAIGDGSVRITDGETGRTIFEGRLSDLHFSSRLGRSARYLRTDRGMFETADNDALDRLGGRSPLSGIAHRLESNKRFIAIALIGVVALCWFAVVHGVPMTAKALAGRVPGAMAQQLSSEVLVIMDRTALSPTGLEESERQELEDFFSATLNRYDDLNLRVLFRDGGKLEANAMALPDGTITT